MGGVRDRSLEVVTSPLDCMFDLIGEIFKRTERNRLFGRINYISIADGGMRDNNLGMAFCPKGSTLEQRFLIPNTLRIDVLPGFDVVDCIHHEAGARPELVVEVVLRILADLQLHRLESRLFINFLANLTGYLTFVLAHELLPEQELTVQITDLDIIIVSADNSPLVLCAQAH